MHDRDGRPAGGFERTDIAPRVVLRWGIALTVFIVASMLTAFAVYALYGGPRGADSQTQARAERRLPPWPRLQANPIKDIDEYRAEQERLATSYGWVDPVRRIVRLPLSRATDMVVRHGLPRWQANQKGDTP